ncbi:MAG: hypothetical protein EOO89_08205 [Pedobacter sp.]|nr:MAG: hypothetical protein EOO89_08205 [Pedobacter sp.]
MLNLLVKSLGKTFFEQHAGMFLFIFYMIFGAVEPGQMLYYNITLLQAISSSTLISGIFCFMLLLYGLKAMAFISNKITLPSYTFIHATSAATRNNQLKVWTMLYSLIFSPMIIYTILIIVTAAWHHQYQNLFMLSGWIAMVIVGAAYITYRNINFSHNLPVKLFRIKLPAVPKPFLLWRMFYVFKKQTIMLLSSKVLSVLLFKGICWMLQGTDHPVKVYLLALLASVISHSILLFAILKFERTQMGFVNSLPISPGRKLFNLAVFLLLLFIPEFILCIIQVGFDPVQLFIYTCFCLSGSQILYYALYYYENNMERYLKFAFYFFLVTVLAILYDQAFLTSMLLLFITGCYHFHLYYRGKL